VPHLLLQWTRQTTSLVSAPAEDARPAILVVDDDEPGRELLVRILNEQGGYESSAAANAVEARELLSGRT
jgi:CheY-like chemotaxis protein